MAAWLAYLKSALLLPKEEQEQPGPEELAMRLQLRLKRLDVMREAGARLLARDRIGRDVFPRGAPEGLKIERRSAWDCGWFELVSAYGRVKARAEPVVHLVRERQVVTLDAALERVSAMLGTRLAWMELREFVPVQHHSSWADPRLRRSALASSFVAALELARLGKAELRQEEPFGPLHLRRAAG
jgi:segregation and condensation protein A